MSNKHCHETRRQLDELLTVHEVPTHLLDHLANCSECTEFQTKQTRLRQLVGSLGPVNAPADFDFKLRARIARSEATKVRNGWLSSAALRVGFVSAAILLAAAFTFLQFRNTAKIQTGAVAEVNTPGSTPVVPDQPKRSDQPTVSAVFDSTPHQSLKEQDTTRKSLKRYVGVPQPDKKTVSADFSSERAPVYGTQRSRDNGDVFPIPTTGQALKIYVEDRSGNARTITVPTVSFGSQRVMSSNQFVSKGSSW